MLLTKMSYKDKITCSLKSFRMIFHKTNGSNEDNDVRKHLTLVPTGEKNKIVL